MSRSDKFNGESNLVRVRRIVRRSSAKTDEANPSISRSGVASFRRLLGYVRPYWRWMTVAVIALVISSLLGLVLPLVIRNLVDFVFVDKEMADLNLVTLGLLGVVVLQSIFTFIQQIALANAGERGVADIRIDVYTHLQELPLSFYADKSSPSSARRRCCSGSTGD